MIADLMTAIKSRYLSDAGASLRAANTGGLWWQQAPQDTAMPFVIVYWISSTCDDFAGGASDRIEKADLQFSVFSDAEDGGTEAADIIKKTQALYDWCALQLPTGSTYTHLAFDRTGTGNMSLNEDGIWHAVILYTVWFEH